MKKRVLWAFVAVWGLGQALAVAGPATWQCEFKGTYTEAGEKEKRTFTWKVKWVESETEADKLTGTAEEAGAKSTTTGTCDDKNTCVIDEVYTDGPEKGKKYFWVGKYTDTETNDATVYMTSFKGTWGPSAADRKSGGTWEAKANCSSK